MTRPETLPALIDRIERVRDWARQEQQAVAERIAAVPGTDAQRSFATTLVTEQFAMVEKAMKILLGEDPVMPPPVDAGPW